MKGVKLINHQGINWDKRSKRSLGSRGPGFYGKHQKNPTLEVSRAWVENPTIPTPAQESLGQESEEHWDVLQDLAQVNYGI